MHKKFLRTSLKLLGFAIMGVMPISTTNAMESTYDEIVIDVSIEEMIVLTSNRQTLPYQHQGEKDLDN